MACLLDNVNSQHMHTGVNTALNVTFGGKSTVFRKSAQSREQQQSPTTKLNEGLMLSRLHW